MAARISSTVRAVIMDIEGTVAPISFVTEVLFPYVTKNLPAYLDKTWDTAETKVRLMRKQSKRRV